MRIDSTKQINKMKLKKEKRVLHKEGIEHMALVQTFSSRNDKGNYSLMTESLGLCDNAGFSINEPE